VEPRPEILDRGAGYAPNPFSRTEEPFSDRTEIPASIRIERCLMKILFISTNRFRIQLALPMPIGLACIIGQMDENEHPIRVLDTMFSENPTADLETALSEFEPDLVAISIRNLDNMSYPEPRYFLPEAKEQLETSIQVLEKFGIGYLLTILIGGPGEDRQSVEETIDFLRDKKAMMVSFTVGIRILPNTALAEMAVEEGLISADDPLMEPRFYISPEVRDWAADYIREVCTHHPNWNLAPEVFQKRPDTLPEKT
jgi:hypothetical protein